MGLIFERVNIEGHFPSGQLNAVTDSLPNGLSRHSESNGFGRIGIVRCIFFVKTGSPCR
jgi:hypothetical protein